MLTGWPEIAGLEPRGKLGESDNDRPQPRERTGEGASDVLLATPSSLNLELDKGIVLSDPPAIMCF